MKGVLYITSSYYRPTEELIIKINTLKVYIGRSLPSSTDINKAKMILIKHIDECIRLSSYALTIIKKDTEKYETFKNFRINCTICWWCIWYCNINSWKSAFFIIKR